MPALLETVVNLNEALNHLHDLDQLLTGLPEEMREVHEEYSSSKAEIERLETTITEATAERRGAEATTQDLTVKLQHFQEQVSRVKTQREYSAILQEIDLAKERTRELEDQVLEAMERQEEAEGELGGLREGFEDLDRRYQVELEKWEAEKPGVASEAETLRGQIETMREEIPPSSLLLFDRIRDVNHGQALAAVRKIRRGRGPIMWHCEACNYNVRPQIVIEIKNNGTLVQCESCKRLLHLEESPG